MKCALVLALLMLASTVVSVDAGVALNTQIVYRIRAVRHDSIPVALALSRAARIRAVELAAADAFDGHAGTVAALSKAGVTRPRWRMYGEVVGWHVRDGATARWYVSAWLRSRTHRSVVLGRWSHVGASCARSAEWMWCVVIFGRRR